MTTLPHDAQDARDRAELLTVLAYLRHKSMSRVARELCIARSTVSRRLAAFRVALSGAARLRGTDAPNAKEN